MSETQKPRAATGAQDAHATALREDFVQGHTLHAGAFLTLKCDTVRLPDGSEATREYVLHPGAVVVVPFLDAETLLLERQFRYPVGLTMLELPAGKLDAGEEPLRCGQRELLEETGYRAREWAYVGKMHLAIAYSTEVIHMYFARGLTLHERQLDHGEFLELQTSSLKDFLHDCDTQRITDAKTLSCAYYVARHAAGHLPLEWKAV